MSLSLSDTDFTPSVSSLNIYRLVTIGLVFFFLCLGLGYAPLNRYNPRLHQGISDSRAYTLIVHQSFKGSSETHWRYRVIIPFIAQGVYELYKNKNLHTWDKQLLSMLIVNSLFMSITGILLILIADSILKDWRTGFIAALLMLAHHVVINYYLVGLIDSGECLFRASPITRSQRRTCYGQQGQVEKTP